MTCICWHRLIRVEDVNGVPTWSGTNRITDPECEIHNTQPPQE